MSRDAEGTTLWLDRFRDAGHRGVTTLASGAEGTVYRLGDGTVGKVWLKRRPAELALVQRLYADVDTVGLPFRTPVILAVDEVDGVAVTLEQELPGEPLQGYLDAGLTPYDAAASGCVIEVLRSLAGVAATDAMRALPVLDERRPLWAAHADFPSALTSLLQRRLDRFGPVLRAHVPDLDRRLERVAERLDTVDRLPPALVHGDLFGQNILVDRSLRPMAVLDFGFLTSAGDPRLDAAITAAVMDMYGPGADRTTDILTARFAAELGYPVDVLLVYRAAYALATSNSFTDDGSDGHFRWCMHQLTRPDVSRALGL